MGQRRIDRRQGGDSNTGMIGRTTVRAERMWRNWQTRKVQVLVAHKAVEVRLLSSASHFLCEVCAELRARPLRASFHNQPPDTTELPAPEETVSSGG